MNYRLSLNSKTFEWNKTYIIHLTKWILDMHIYASYAPGKAEFYRMATIIVRTYISKDLNPI